MSAVTYIKHPIISNFEQQFPVIAAKVHIDNYTILSEYDAKVKLDDGTVLLYDDIEKTIRELPRDSMIMTEDECKIEFSKRLQKIMFRRGMSQSRLSELANIPQPALSSYVNGKCMPSLYNLDKLAKALGCSVDDFRYI